VRYDTLPKFTRRGFRAHPWRVIAFSVAGVIVLVSKGNLLFPVMAAFIVFGIARGIYDWVRTMATHAEKDAEEESEISSIDI
jgi:hypothetical protein